MSVRSTLTEHLDEYLVLVQQLLHSLKKPYAVPGHVNTQVGDEAITQPRGNASGLTKGRLKLAQIESLGGGDELSGVSGVPLHPQVVRALEALLEKDSQLQRGVSELVRYQERQARTRELREQVREVDEVINRFARDLGDMEQNLHELVMDEQTLRSVHGGITRQAVKVDEVILFAEALGRKSSAPVPHSDRMGLKESDPPAPQQHLISHSRLAWPPVDIVAGDKIDQDSVAAADAHATLDAAGVGELPGAAAAAAAAAGSAEADGANGVAMPGVAGAAAVTAENLAAINAVALHPKAARAAPSSVPSLGAAFDLVAPLNPDLDDSSSDSGSPFDDSSDEDMD